MTKTIAIIPARRDSKRLPGKNTKLLGGLPLLVHSILYAKAHLDLLDKIYVTTNDEIVKRIAEENGVKVIHRPEHLAGANEPTITAIQHVLDSIKEEVENVILLQPTNPLRPDFLLKEAFAIFEKENCDSLFTVSRNHQKLGKIVDRKFIPYNYKIGQRSQDLEPLFFENGLLYITKASLIKKGTIISENAYPLVVDHIFGQVDIDTLEDFEYAEYLLLNFKFKV